MGIKNFFTQKRFDLYVKNGQVGKKKKETYTVWETEEEGIVTIRKENYYYLGVSERPYEEVSGAKALTGAAIGTIFAPGIGTLLGGAVGAIKKKGTRFVFAFMNVDTEEVYTVEAEVKPIVGKLEAFKAHPKKEELEKQKEESIVISTSANEIREFKKLLDDGIISEDEFNKKKLELLG
ncbi:SHOCT domain-containing protein [Shouchella lehensis]|uniref:SHOCT domain-containing protein n=1 Tax=Shouchella lehensis TaxID=300825 RepID=A0A4Y7WJ06_9BACI|nr:SHOCT domain-containing protein [Shouchella lehensis]MBG9785631.1 hypothetical protein [Shouchella lehensis]TES48085.1 SHOCT domain-containing protein [Shouchella lehensis]